ncbi:MAG: amidohydrolase family protein [Shimia sp.]
MADQMLPRASMPHPTAPPSQPAPEGAVDSHFHLVGSDFPLWEKRVEDPADDAPLATWVARYREMAGALGLSKGVLVHSILYGTDNSVTEAALRALGPGFKGVGLLGDGADGAALDRFADAGFVAVRLNYVHGGVLSWAGAKAMAPALAARGLHIQMLLHSHLHMAEIAGDIRALPCPLVIDHLGWPDLSLGVDDPGFQTLLALLGEGKVILKLSALYRLCSAPYAAAAPFVEAALRANPEALLWGTDWPHLMLGEAALPRTEALWEAFVALTTPEQRAAILIDTPRRLFAL